MLKRLVVLVLMVGLTTHSYGAGSDRIIRSRKSKQYSVNGRKGSDGTNGTSHTGASFYGDGANGGDAGTGSPGTNAGEVHLKIKKQDRRKGVLLIQGKLVTDQGTSRVEEIVHLSDTPILVMESLGGGGGNGGNGGNGEDGARGRDGDDA
ncbi:MAG: hypothetical protein EOP09_13880, partial [Proteobacteria bacterium]